MLWLFQSASKRNSNNTHYQFWQQHNQPIELSTNTMMDKRLDYIHDNPVKAGLVYAPEHYIYCSALDCCGDKALLKIELLGRSEVANFLVLVGLSYKLKPGRGNNKVLEVYTQASEDLG
ncbi:MAG: hypothetical protein MJA30_31575 [Cytophagales bacterium]|nr:hypothetical protein [Cytophagales bacterium]